MNDNLTIQTHPKNVSIDIGDDIVKVKFLNDLALCVDFNNSVMFKTNGDFVISAKGEIDLISEGSPICLDSLGNKIHLNSRESKPIKNHPTSILYKQALIDNNILKKEEKSLKERIVDLEHQMNSLLKILEIKVK